MIYNPYNQLLNKRQMLLK